MSSPAALPIGRFAKLSGLSIKVLRHYAELGLLKPAHVNPSSGYRYYSPAQLREAEHIRLLRTLEIPLAEIRALISRGDRPSVRRRLERYRQRIDQRIDDYRRLRLTLQALIDGKDEPKLYTVTLKETPSVRALTLAIRGSVEQSGPQISRGFSELYSHLMRSRAVPRGPAGAIYDRALITLFVPVLESPALKKGMAIIELQAGLAASALHIGGYEDRSGAHQAVRSWVVDHGYEASGPLRELYVVGPAQALDPAEYRTEVLCPVRGA